MQDAEKVRKQFEQERKQRLEVIKLKPEDKRWAQQHGLTGDRGLFQAAIRDGWNRGGLASCARRWDARDRDRVELGWEGTA